MRCILGLLCVSALLILSGGCGTARALVNDRAADVVVTAIRPTSGESGETVTFEAMVCLKPSIGVLDAMDPTDPNMPEFTWNFGGGAEPNVSFEHNPTVLLRAGSVTPYNASLTLTSGCLGDDSLTVPFTLSIAPLQVLSVTGTTGVAKGTGSFSVVMGTGVPDTFSWDFGGAGSPSGSTSSNPTITFSATPGTYQGRVIVSNEFEAVEADFTITVI
jgi:hypothetical protein